METIYVAGGYYETCPGKPREFGLVSSSGHDKPYLTKNANGLKLTSHHANLYCLSKDLKFAMLVELRCPGVSNFHPCYGDIVALTTKQISDVQRSIDTGYFFD